MPIRAQSVPASRSILLSGLMTRLVCSLNPDHQGGGGRHSARVIGGSWR